MFNAFILILNQPRSRHSSFRITYISYPDGYPPTLIRLPLGLFHSEYWNIMKTTFSSTFKENYRDVIHEKKILVQNPVYISL